MREGTIFFNAGLDRMDIKFAEHALGGLHCGDWFDIFYHDRWHPARVEYDHKSKEWYMIYGQDGKILDIPMVGLRVRLE